MDITIPGVQNPHWDPWNLTIRSLNFEKIIKTPFKRFPNLKQIRKMLKNFNDV